MKRFDQSLVCILGMHRSGTSCLTGSLQQRGLNLGVVNKSAPYNQKGNREHQLAVQVNRAVLAYNNASWDNPPDNLIWNDELREMRDNLLRRYRFRGIAGFKDPRTLLTLPFWQEAVPDLTFVATFRNPNSVVSSLNKRTAIKPKLAGMNLWLHYNRKLMALADRHNFPVISFDWEPESYLAAVDEVAFALGLSGEPDEKSDLTSGEEFFETNLRSAHNSRLSELPPRARELYGRLSAHAEAFMFGRASGPLAFAR